MDMFIQIRDGQPYEHPIIGSNFRAAFPDIDTNNLPPEFAKFERVEPPFVGIFETYEGCTYELIGGVYTDVHHVRSMTAEERTARIEAERAMPHPDGWVFNEAACIWVPPELDTSVPGSEPNVVG
jgi:hypothetical protein